MVLSVKGRRSLVVTPPHLPLVLPAPSRRSFEEGIPDAKYMAVDESEEKLFYYFIEFEWSLAD